MPSRPRINKSEGHIEKCVMLFPRVPTNKPPSKKSMSQWEAEMHLLLWNRRAQDLLQNSVEQNIEHVCAEYPTFTMSVAIFYCWCAETCWVGLVYGRFHQPGSHLSAHTEQGLGWAALLESRKDSHTSLSIHLEMDRALAALPLHLLLYFSPSLLFSHRRRGVVGAAAVL